MFAFFFFSFLSFFFLSRFCVTFFHYWWWFGKSFSLVLKKNVQITSLVLLCYCTQYILHIPNSSNYKGGSSATILHTMYFVTLTTRPLCNVCSLKFKLSWDHWNLWFIVHLKHESIGVRNLNGNWSILTCSYNLSKNLLNLEILTGIIFLFVCLMSSLLEMFQVVSSLSRQIFLTKIII